MEHTPYVSKSVEDTHVFAENFLHALHPNMEGATLVCLSGDLGAGKTAFAKELGSLLGIKKEEITSPTFVIEKIYPLKTLKVKLPFTHFIHIDAYRLESGSELLSLGWEEIIANTQNLICIEWPEKVSEIIPNTAITLNLRFIDENTREIQRKS